MSVGNLRVAEVLRAEVSGTSEPWIRGAGDVVIESWLMGFTRADPI